LDKLHREIALMPRSKISLDLVSKALIPLFALIAAGYALSLNVPQTQLQLLKAQKELLEAQKTADATKEQLRRSQAELTKIEAAKNQAYAVIEQARLVQAQQQQQAAEKAARSADLADVRNAEESIEAYNKIDAALANAQAKLSAAGNTGVATYGAYSVDVFYCTTSPGNKALAEAALKMGKPRSIGNWRIRELTSAMNSRSGYGIKANQIRFNADEREIAIRIKNDLGRELRAAVAESQIAYPTPNYISLFFCAGG
jgi:hypothetical protein